MIRGFSPGVKDPTVARSVCHYHPLLLCSWIASLPSARFSSFSPALNFGLDTVEDFEGNRRRVSPRVMASLVCSRTVLLD